MVEEQKEVNTTTNVNEDFIQYNTEGTEAAIIDNVQKEEVKVIEDQNT